MLARQFIRYLLVGGLGTVAHLLILSICVEWLGQSATFGSVLGFIAALCASYALNHRWVFESHHAHLSSMWRYLLISLIGLMLNTGMMVLLVHYLQWWYFKAQLSIIWVVPICNFLLNRFWTFDTYVRK